MSFAQELAQGRPGVRFLLPETFELETDDDKSLQAIAKQRTSALWVFCSEHHLDLNPAHAQILRQDLERAARDIFVQTSSQSPRIDAGEGLPTDTPTWSPLVDVTPVELSGGAALAVLHRMTYQPGSEMIMGHILIPVLRGMIEFRFLTRAQMTGLRESAATMRKLEEQPLQEGADPIEQLKGRSSQKDFDDPALDEAFPDHPLSQARALLRRLQAEGTITVTEPPRVPPGEISSETLGYAFVPPPRYLPHEETSSRIQLAKMSIATTDGTSLLTVVRIGILQPSLASNLKGFVQMSSSLMAPEGSTEVKCTVRSVPGTIIDAEGQLTFVRGDGFLGQTAIRAFTDQDGDIWLLTIGTGQSTPSEELFQELDGVVRSFRKLAKQPKMPWYQFWKS